MKMSYFCSDDRDINLDGDGDDDDDRDAELFLFSYFKIDFPYLQTRVYLTHLIGVFNFCWFLIFFIEVKASSDESRSFSSFASILFNF